VGKKFAIVGLLAGGVLGFIPSAAGQQTGQEVMDAMKGIVPIGIRSIPSEHMAPNLLVGDRVAIVAFDRDPRRGDVVIYHHPHSDRVMINRIVGLPGDRIQMKGGQLILNGEIVERTLVRKMSYPSDSMSRVIAVSEYSEQLPGEERPHLIHEFSNTDSLDETPEFHVPDGHLFMMGDSRDNSEDSRAPSGHRAMAIAQPEAWPYRGVFLSNDTRDDAVGFVPIRNLMGRGATVPYTLHVCIMTPEERASGVECLPSRLWKPL
jgi:signal peptidase I